MVAGLIDVDDVGDAVVYRHVCISSFKRGKGILPFGEIDTSGLRPVKVTVTSVALLSTFTPKGNRRTRLFPVSATHSAEYFVSKIIPLGVFSWPLPVDPKFDWPMTSMAELFVGVDEGMGGYMRILSFPVSEIKRRPSLSTVRPSAAFNDSAVTGAWDEVVNDCWP